MSGTPSPTLPGTPPEAPTRVSVSRGLADWLTSRRTSFAFSCYQTGQLFLVGATPEGRVSLHQQAFERAMGLAWQPSGRLYVGALDRVWRLENVLRPGETANGGFDVALAPRNAQVTGDVDIHELAIDADGRVLFANTKYSCLATLDLRHSFRPVWKPPFISRLAPEDRCHLNGLAMDDGQPRYMTAVSRSDVVGGWRERRASGGVLLGVPDGRVVADQLSMPHSPRIDRDGSVLLLDSGRGRIVRLDPASGARVDLAFCPGFLRGLSLHDGHALVTISRPREGGFEGLPLREELTLRDASPWCGVLVVDLANGDIVEWVRLDGAIGELFDVAVMPGVRRPMAIGPETPELRTTITFDEDALS